MSELKAFAVGMFGIVSAGAMAWTLGRLFRWTGLTMEYHEEIGPYGTQFMDAGWAVIVTSFVVLVSVLAYAILVEIGRSVLELGGKEEE